MTDPYADTDWPVDPGGATQPPDQALVVPEIPKPPPTGFEDSSGAPGSAFPVQPDSTASADLTGEALATATATAAVVVGVAVASVAAPAAAATAAAAAAAAFVITAAAGAGAGGESSSKTHPDQRAMADFGSGDEDEG